MAKSRKQQQSVAIKTQAYKTLPWKCTHFGKQSEIDAFMQATGKWETIAQINSVNGIDAEDIAAFIVQIVNDYKEKLDRLQEADRLITHIDPVQ